MSMCVWMHLVGSWELYYNSNCNYKLICHLLWMRSTCRHDVHFLLYSVAKFADVDGVSVCFRRHSHSHTQTNSFIHLFDWLYILCIVPLFPIALRFTIIYINSFTRFLCEGLWWIFPILTCLCDGKCFNQIWFYCLSSETVIDQMYFIIFHILYNAFNWLKKLFKTFSI